VKIFISYREEDAAGHAGRLYDSLCRRFPEEDVFFYRAKRELGTQFRRRIETEVAASGVVVAVIGPDWASLKKGRRRRLDDPADIVRFEVACALRRQKMIIPVLVRGASMPDAGELPRELHDLPGLEGLPLPDEYWPTGVERLADAIKRSAPIHDSGEEGASDQAFELLMKHMRAETQRHQVQQSRYYFEQQLKTLRGE
jgi:hypothetical protein